MGTDSAFFVAGLVGLLAGYIVGDFQRELRWRRDAKRNLALAVERLPGSHRDAGPGTLPDLHSSRTIGTYAGPDGDSNSDGAAFALGSVRNGQARRTAIPGDNDRARAAAAVRRGAGRRSTATPVSAGHDCG